MPEEYLAIAHKLRALPAEISALVDGLTADQLTAPHMPGEWTVAQNVHHLAEAQMMLYGRFKLILLEDTPPLKPFDQDDWAATADATTANIQPALGLLEGVHQRWADLIESMRPEDWSRYGDHPETGQVDLYKLAGYAAEHGYLHIAQIRQTLAAGGITS